MKKISVLMPAYNARLYIKESINSILTQSYANVEVLICDDCSTDDTYQIISSLTDPRVKFYKNEENLGYLKTCNKLSELASGDYITFQDADDFSAKERFEILVAELERRHLDLIGSNVNYTSNNGDIIGRSFYLTDVSQKALLAENMPFCGSAILCKREVIDNIGLYDECFNRIGAEDFDWVYRASLLYKMGNNEKPLYRYRMHPESVSQSTSSQISIQLCSEEIAKALFIARIDGLIEEKTEDFVTQQKEKWQIYLDANPSIIILKQSTINSLSGKRLRNISLIFKLLKTNASFRAKLRASLLMLADVILGYANVFKLKTFYKKVFS